MNLTSHTWWEPGKSSQNAIYFHTKGHRVHSASQNLELAGQWALDVWKINVHTLKTYCVHTPPINPFSRQRTSCPTDFTTAFLRENCKSTKSCFSESFLQPSWARRKLLLNCEFYELCSCVMDSDWSELSNDPPGNLKHLAASHVCSFKSLTLCSLDLTESIHCRTHTITTLMHGVHRSALLENVAPFTRADNDFCKSLRFYVWFTLVILCPSYIIWWRGRKGRLRVVECTSNP